MNNQDTTSTDYDYDAKKWADPSTLAIGKSERRYMPLYKIGLSTVDRLGTPVIVKTPWKKLSGTPLYSEELDLPF